MTTSQDVAGQLPQDPVAPALTKPTPPHLDPHVPPQERHVMMCDRQELLLSWAGLVAALLVTAALIAVSTVVILAGHGWEGTVIASVDVVGLAAVFIASGRRGGPNPSADTAQ
ncbi:hypothetical protein [Haloechinothrix halophila]|uniref:hypothetical protein n=1 Tax=Haloechinothrix halophila TaxID=1069073 RepID=UPI001E47B1B8|nr:hypothetical protein [Haloechinothrix halophila]